MTEPGPESEPESAAEPAAEPPDWYQELRVGGRRWPWWGWFVIVAIFFAVLGWWVVHPTELPRRDEDQSIAVKAGQTAYVGVLGAADAGGSERTITIRDVSFETSADGLELEALICRGGSISTTTLPEPFCQAVVDANGTFVIGGPDQLIVAISADTAVTATIEEINVSYRQGLQFATQPTGPRIDVLVVQ